MFIETPNNTMHSSKNEFSHDDYQQAGGSGSRNKQSKKNVHILITVLGLVGFGYILYWGYQNFLTDSPNSSIFTKTYSGVFLDNGDVYFGKLSNKESAFLTITDPYYVRVDNVKDGKLPVIPEVKLVKVGIEGHKPKPLVEVQRGHILSIVELQPDSPIVKLIEQDLSHPTK